MGGKIKIIVCSDTDYEQLIAEIYIDGKFVALLSQDDGIDNLSVEFAGCDQNQTAITRRVKYVDIHAALELARVELLQK